MNGLAENITPSLFANATPPTGETEAARRYRAWCYAERKALELCAMAEVMDRQAFGDRDRANQKVREAQHEATIAARRLIRAPVMCMADAVLLCAALAHCGGMFGDDAERAGLDCGDAAELSARIARYLPEVPPDFPCSELFD